MSAEKLNIDELEFDHCEDEPIHIPESVQGYGYLFALDPENGKIQVVSKNTSELFTFSVDELIDYNFYELLSDKEYIELLKVTHKRAKNKRARLPLRLRFKDNVIVEEEALDYFAIVYTSDDYTVIELEPAVEFRETYSAMHFIKLYAMSIAPKFKKDESMEKMAQDIVDTIKYVTDMERVVLYRFNTDNSGKVIAEAKEDDIESYLNLYYPASDIPAQARELYVKNWVRLIPDVDMESSPLLPSIEESGRDPLDMTYSITRTMSPIHKQYIRNQGLKSSLSLSLVTHDHLWGIISCHSRETRYIPQNVRLECENLSQLFSWHLYAKEEEQYLNKKQRTNEAINELIQKTSPHNSIISVFKENKNKVLELMGTDGFAFYFENDSFQLGMTPHDDVIRKLLDATKDSDEEFFSVTDISDYVNDECEMNGIHGALLIRVAQQRNYFTAWFRKEHRYTQRWAGRPEEKDYTASKKERLMPRTSFEVHEKEIVGESRNWDENDINIAKRFNKVFMAYALEQQDLMRKDIDTLQLQDRYKNEFIATLAHELKNPLTPIRTGISILEHSSDEAEKERVLKVMRRQTTAITKMIDDLLDVSRISEGKITLEKKKISIQNVLKQVIEVSEEMIRGKKHKLMVDFPDQPVYVNADLLRLSQVFINILNNAAKYTPNNGEISVYIRDKDNEVQIKVSDNGLGIPKEKQKQIFDMFTQMESHSHNSEGGLGIGLTLVNRLVSLHGGDVHVHSDGDGKGSTFTVILPKH